MLKMYHQHQQPGASSAYWEDFGREGTLADRLRFCEIDPLRPLFLRYVKPGATMLEGGCGRGQYVAYYTARGVKVIGLDFAREWLASIHREMPALKLCAGDVGSLPFADGTFDAYYSGGVVEHFERGAERPLAEARRVLKRNGVLLIGVPYFSPLRRVLTIAKRGEWRRVGGPSVDNPGAPDAAAALGWNGNANGRTFYQYAYEVRDFTRMLTAAGLRVIETQGYAIAWGLYDIGAIRSAMTNVGRAFQARRRSDDQGPAERSHSDGGPERAAPRQSAAPQQPSLLKRLLVAEDATVPGAGPFVRAGRWACANMMMYVATPA
jgi:SAM-dependent methyltransferase